jgi:hypothetical protein
MTTTSRGTVLGWDNPLTSRLFSDMAALVSGGDAHAS